MSNIYACDLLNSTNCPYGFANSTNKVENPQNGLSAGSVWQKNVQFRAKRGQKIINPVVEISGNPFKWEEPGHILTTLLNKVY